MARASLDPETPSAPPEDGPLVVALAGMHDLRYVVMRGDLQTAVGEYDVLVHPRDLTELRNRLDRSGFVRLPSWGYRPHRFHAAYDRSRDGWVKLDLVTELRFGIDRALAVGTIGPVLDERISDGVASVPGPLDRFWLLLLHVMLDEPSSDHNSSLRELLPPVRELPPFVQDLPLMVRPGTVIEWVEADRWDLVAAAGGWLGEALAREQRFRAGLRRLRARGARAIGRVLERSRRPTVVHLVAGTTRTASELASIIRERVPIPVEVGLPRGRVPSGRSVVYIALEPPSTVHVEIHAAAATGGGLRLMDPPWRIAAAIWEALPARQVPR